MEGLLYKTGIKNGVRGRYEILFVRSDEATTTAVRKCQDGFGRIYLDCISFSNGRSVVVFEHLVNVLERPYFIFPLIATFWDGTILQMAFQNGVLWTWNWCPGKETIQEMELDGVFLSEGAWSQSGKSFLAVTELGEVILLSNAGRRSLAFRPLVHPHREANFPTGIELRAMDLGIVNVNWLEGGERFSVTAARSEGEGVFFWCYDLEGTLVYEFTSPGLVKSTNFDMFSSSHLIISRYAEIVLLDCKGFKQKSIFLTASHERFDQFKVECFAWNFSGELIAMVTESSLRIWKLQNSELRLIHEIPLLLRSAGVILKAHPMLLWHRDNPCRLTFCYNDEIMAYDFQDCKPSSVLEPCVPYLRILDGYNVGLFDLSTQMGTLGPPSMQLKLPFVPTYTAAGRKELVVSTKYLNCIQLYLLDAGYLSNTLKYSVFIGKKMQLLMCHATTDEQLLLVLMSENKHKCLVRLNLDTITLICAVRLIASNFQAFIPTTDDAFLIYIDDGAEIHGVDAVSPVPLYFGKLSGRGSAAVAVNSSTKRHHICCMKDNGDLELDGRVIAYDCTSFDITEQHLYASFRNGNIVVYSLETKSSVYSHHTEAGATIKHLSPQNCAVVLGMARGSFEFLYPRFLLEALVKSLVAEQNYKDAFKISRLHKIEITKLLIGYLNANNVAVEIPRILGDLQRKELIEEFVSSVSAEEVKRSLLRNLGSNLEHNLDTVVFTLLCGNPSQVDKAVAALRSLGPSYEKKNPKVFERALNKLLSLSDHKLLFEECLRCDDLDLALVLTERFYERKPECFMFLKNAAGLDDRSRKFTIYKYLGNYEAALASLDVETSAGFEEYLRYTEAESIYRIAIERRELTETQSKKILFGYGNSLFNEQSYHRSGIIFETIGAQKLALVSYCKSASWREALHICYKMGMNEENRASVASTLARSLVEKREFEDAAVIYRDYLNDWLTSVDTLCQGELYDEAYRVASICAVNQHFKIIEDHLLKSARALLNAAEQSAASLDNVAGRLLQLQNGTTNDDETAVDYDWDDGISLVSILTSASYRTDALSKTSTNASQTSYNSKRELKSRRKGRKGTLYEVEHLKHELYSIRRHSAQYKCQFARLAATLVRNGHRALAISLRNSIERLARKVDSLSLYSDTELEQIPIPDFIL